MNDLSSLIICNAILPKPQQEDILLAAINATNGYEIGAERFRKQAGYGSVGFREDADKAAVQ